MFSTKEKNESAKPGSINPAASGHALNSIVKGTSIEGTIKATSDIRIDGAIKGKLYGDAKVIIGPTGTVEGEIKCQNAVIEGRFDGVLIVKELLNVRENAVVNGEVTTGKLIVQSGGIFNVTACSMGGDNNPVVQQKNQESGKSGKPVGA
ncbi:MAG: polymer-forming cytoskeletal protein [Saprospiraceae bacterium]|nr:polymer-forming cytoskeletal protein [Saprospiraceae bacterium]MCB9324536.1 polymer-forming cytoskeletal protein [Lewinellaceae bacterium]